MTHNLPYGLAVSIVVGTCAVPLWADAKAEFDAIFGEQVQKVAAGGSKKDAVLLAEKLVASAKELQGSQDLRLLMLEKAIDLGLQAPAGYDTVDQAIDMLMTVAPQRRAEWQNRRLQILLARFQSARGDEKQQAGDEYLAYLIAFADEESEAGQADQAIAHYKQALETAKKFKAATKSDIAAKIKYAEARKDLQKQEQQLRETLAAKPGDAATRERLIRLLLLEMDSPSRAADLLTVDLEEATRTYVRLATKDIDQLDEKIVLELGRWYESMLNSASPVGAPVVLHRARAYYRRYLELHTTKDAEALKASMALKRVDEEARQRGITWAKDKTSFSDPNVADAVRRACKYLWSVQKPDGSWPEYPMWQNGVQVSAYGVGTTALATFALLEAGADSKHPGMGKAVRWLAERPTAKTYCLAFRCAAIGAMDGVTRSKMLGRLRDDARLLASSGARGNYNYDCTGQPRTDRDNWDNSNGQYGVLGLWCASQSGLSVPRTFWMSVMKHWQQCQREDGGWQYRRWGEGTTDTMTAAGLASLYAAIDGMSASPDAAKRSAASCIPIKRGLAWMDKRFPRDKNKTLQMPYFLYVLSRVGLASGRQMFGTTDWGAWGTQWLLEHQRKPHINKTCPTCGRTYDPSATQCWQCKQELPEPPISPDATINWNDNSWDTALSILFLVNAERAKNP